MRHWPAPHLNCMTGPGTQGRDGGMNIQTAAASWPAPSARDWKSGDASDQTMERNSRPLNEVAVRFPLAYSPLAPPTSTGGQTSLNRIYHLLPRSVKRKLNPNFVDWLMGWPTGWSGYRAVGMESFHLWRRMHISALMRICGAHVQTEPIGTEPIGVEDSLMPYGQCEPDCGRCSACELDQRFVPGDGPLPCLILFIGEKPGQQEANIGRPFIGDSGKEFNQNYLHMMGTERGLVRITNSVHCRLGGNNNTPTAAQVQACAGHHLAMEVAECQPELIVLMGSTACSLVPAVDLTRDHGIPRKIAAGGMPLVPEWAGWVVAINHPAAGLHDTALMQPLMEDFERVGKWLRGEWEPPVDEWQGREDYREVQTVEELVEDFMPGPTPPRVVHCKKEPYTLYIGRPSELGNPFSHRPSSVPGTVVGPTVEWAIDQFEQHAREHLMEKIAEIPEGAVLGCWCKPGPCHGDVIVKLWKELHRGGESDFSTSYRWLPVDTENDGPRQWSLQYSLRPGHGRMIMADNREVLEMLDHFIGSFWPLDGLAMHNAAHDLEELERMGFKGFEWRDTMQEAYHLCNLPQGLKALAWRLFGVEMQSWEDLVTPPSLAKLRAWLEAVMEVEQLDAEERIITYTRMRVKCQACGKVTCGRKAKRGEEPGMYPGAHQPVELDQEEPQSEQRCWGCEVPGEELGFTEIERIATVGEKTARHLLRYLDSPTYKPWDKIREMVRDRGLGWEGWPIRSIANVEREKAVRYSCRDADVTGRLMTWLEQERTRRMAEGGEWYVD